MVEDMRNRAPITEEPAGKEEYLTPELERQVDGFVDAWKSYNQSLPEYLRADEANYRFVSHLYKKVISERNKRAAEVATQEYQDALEVENNQFPLRPYSMLCMDGRVLFPLIFGITYGCGGGIRVPGGMLQEFDRGTDGNLFLRDNASFADGLSRAFEKADEIAEIFDSHLGCAARIGEEESRGAHPADYGLYRDVLVKKEMAEASRRFVKEKYQGKKKLFPIQTSFDPHNGFLFMGFETELALDYVKSKTHKGHEPEYTEGVRSHLVNEGLVIHTEQLAKELEEVFDRYKDLKFDWKKDYVLTTRNFWSSIAEMKEDIAPVIKEKLIKVFPHLSLDNEDVRLELEERMILLLANSFNGFMLNLMDLGTFSPLDGRKPTAYQYGDHHEEAIKIYEGGQPPFATSAFVLYSLDVKNLPEGIEKAAGLVRKNRREGRVTDSSGNFKDAASFEKAIVPVLVHEIVREPLSGDEWNCLIDIDWSDMPINWDTMPKDMFFNYLKDKGVNYYPIMENINNLRTRVAVLFDPEVRISTHLTDQFKMVLPTIMNKGRENKFVIPFLKTGYSRQ
jgi:hypothetical protein